jgi:glycosyltransferase involved in cell wall biosynthesis
MTGGLRTRNIVKSAKENEPLVSIITVVLNGEMHLEQTIKSVIDQSYKNIEYIIIDGGSKDGTLEIMKKHGDSIDYWKSEPDEGIYFAMNKGISVANGEIIGILNADDYYFPDTVSKIISANKLKSADVFYGDMVLISDNNNASETIMKPDLAKMNEKPSVFHPTCFVKKSVYITAGFFDTTYKISSDYEFLLRCISKKIAFHYIPEPITVFRPGGLSASCYSNVEGYKIMKKYNTGYQNAVIVRGIKCYLKTFIKKIFRK